MPGFQDYDFEGTFTIGGFSMCRPAWAVLGDDTGEGTLFDLITDGELRGEDRLLPLTNGVIGYPRFLTVTRYDLRLLVNGDVDSVGAATSDSQVGLAANLAALRSGLFESASPAPDGTLVSVVTIPGWGSKSANIHMVGLKRQRMNIWNDMAVWEGTLQISVPAGRFA
jgi:hypothetical protein